MVITDIRKRSSQGRTYNKDPFYQSSSWKATREGFKNAVPVIKLPSINGIPYSNRYCADCWEQGRINNERIEIDHIKARADGGDQYSYDNLRSRCHTHHNRKTHNERKKRYNKV